MRYAILRLDNENIVEDCCPITGLIFTDLSAVIFQVPLTLADFESLLKGL
jgi:hypothetical protein